MLEAKANREISILFITSRLRATGCFFFELKKIFSLWGLWLVFYCRQIIYRLEGCPAPQREGKNNPRLHATPTPLCPTRWVFKEIPRGNVSKGTWMLGLETTGCSVYSIALDLCGSDLKEDLTFPNYIDHREWNLFCKRCSLFWINQISSIHNWQRFVITATAWSVNS
jgi:hypothetical protein